MASGRDGHKGDDREEIHLPGSSLIPLFAAIGITVGLVGLILSWAIVAAGALIALVTLVVWIRTVRNEISDLPSSRS